LCNQHKNREKRDFFDQFFGLNAKKTQSKGLQDRINLVLYQKGFKTTEMACLNMVETAKNHGSILYVAVAKIYRFLRFRF